jgi:hypothetical protein
MATEHADRAALGAVSRVGIDLTQATEELHGF